MIDRLYSDAGIRIQKLRDQRGYTRESLAELADISNKFLYEIETGKKGFSAIVLYRLAEALDVTCDYILTGGSKAGNYNTNLLGAIELFEEEKVHKLIQLLKIVYELRS